MTGKRRFHAVIRGRVQGVNYRSFVETAGEKLGVTGWVRNLGEGDLVEVEAEGGENELKLLIDRLKTGPPEARVDDVDLEWLPYEGKYTGFQIIY